MGSITISDWLIILATISGPILAVQAQKFIERARARHEQRLSIFYRLMAYRATQLAPERIQALNMIDLEFRRNRFGRQSSKDMAVTTAWKSLLDELNGGISDTVTDPATIGAWQRRCDDLSVDLLFALSKALGYEFSKVELKRGIYYPRGHLAREASQNSVLANLEKLLAGGASLKMEVTGFPVSEDALKLQERLHNGMLEALSGKGELHVRVKGPKQSPAAE
jgi:hypothetical protein